MYLQCTIWNLLLISILKYYLLIKSIYRKVLIMKLQQVLSHVRKAIDDFHMIEDGDKIAIGISGGKDSLCLLYALHGLRRFYPKKFDIIAITVDLGFGNLI